MSTQDTIATIRPLILAGGLGTRLRPRTNFLPKPLLPINGCPLLWYSLQNCYTAGLLPPFVTTDYLGDLIQAFFADTNAHFKHLPGRTMAEAVLETVENDTAVSFLGMSSDVLVPKRAFDEILRVYLRSGRQDTVLFVKLPKQGHKKWEFIVKDGQLIDIFVRDFRTSFERVLLILNQTSLRKIRSYLGQSVTEHSIPKKLQEFQTGWILILKSMIEVGIPVCADIVDIPVWNINTPADFNSVEQFVEKEMQI